MNEFLLAVLTNVGLMSFLALSAYVLLIGGEMSFGQQAFFGIGAYAAGIGTAMAGLPLPLALLGAALLGGLLAALLGRVTLRLSGLHFSIATLAAAEALHIFFQLFEWQIPVDGDLVGPLGTAGFGGIRYVLAHDIGPLGFLAIVYGVLGAVLLGFVWARRTRALVQLRMVGEDPALAGAFGIDVLRVKRLAAAAAGAIAALGGGLFAHANTFVEPDNFDVMLGIHALSYALIGGLGTPLGPLVGVALDVGLLETSRAFHGYRMIVFGGLVILLLIVRPRGLLDEALIERLRGAARGLGRGLKYGLRYGFRHGLEPETGRAARRGRSSEEGL